MGRLVCACSTILVAASVPAAPARCADTTPLVLVVHGIGGGNRPDGWSDDVAKTWKTPVTEVTFRMAGRTNASSYTDFAREAGDWALSVQHQIQDAVRANPGRRVIIVSHSWGTVATKMALAGGTGGGSSPELVSNVYNLDPINLGGVQVDEWITLGSPLGRANDPKVAGTLQQLNVDIPDGRPQVVKHWTNIYDPDDPVSRQSHNLAGADNVEVKNSGDWDEEWVKLPYLSAHAGIWRNPAVVDDVRTKRRDLGALPPTTSPARPAAPANAGNPKSSEGQMHQRLPSASAKPADGKGAQDDRAAVCASFSIVLEREVANMGGNLDRRLERKDGTYDAEHHCCPSSYVIWAKSRETPDAQWKESMSHTGKCEDVDNLRRQYKNVYPDLKW